MHSTSPRGFSASYSYPYPHEDYDEYDYDDYNDDHTTTHNMHSTSP